MIDVRALFGRYFMSILEDAVEVRNESEIYDKKVYIVKKYLIA